MIRVLITATLIMLALVGFYTLTPEPEDTPPPLYITLETHNGALQAAADHFDPFIKQHNGQKLGVVIYHNRVNVSEVPSDSPSVKLLALINGLRFHRNEPVLKWHIPSYLTARDFGDTYKTNEPWLFVMVVKP